jgi:predicted lipoprotein with Yx(FWY)xxD motif
MRSRLLRCVLPLVGVGVIGVGAAMAATTATQASKGTVDLVKSSKYGMVLVNAGGRTLYRYTPDKKGKSTCSGQCATYWPPLMAKGKATAGAGANAKLVGTIKRGAGLQVTYAGYPLYTYAGDKKAGQMTGEGVEKTWYVVTATGALVKKAVVGTTTTTTAPATTTTSGGSAWG